MLPIRPQVVAEEERKKMRSETIMDASEEVLGVEESLKVTVAMGLTKEEAKRLNIRYE